MHDIRRWPVTLGALVAFTLLVSASTYAAEWGNIIPGTTTSDGVRGQYGEPSRISQSVVDGHETTQWVYEERRAPSGISRLTIDFGLLTRDGYRAGVVRALTLEPRPGVFPLGAVVGGWGPPDGDQVVDGRPAMFFRSGLIVYFDAEMRHAVTLIFTLPQPAAPPARP